MQAVIAEARLGEPLITYWNSPNGSICNNDVVGLYRILQTLGKARALSFFIKSDGGYGQASLRMVNLLRQFVERLTVLVPLECKSAATILLAVHFSDHLFRQGGLVR